MKKSVLSIAMLLLLATATAAGAEVKAGSYSVTPFVGGYLFEGNQDLKHAPVYGLRGGYNFTPNWGVEGVFDYVATKDKVLAGEPRVDAYGLGIEGLYHFMPQSRLVPFVALGTGWQRLSGSDGFNDRNRLFVDYGAGLKYFLTDALALRADVRHVLPFNDHNGDLLYTVGLNFAFGGAKKAAPAVMATRAAEPAAPAEVKRDSDGDGIFDDKDRCPDTPRGVTVDENGCPLDSDRDGVPDTLDKCPGTPAVETVDKDGCPPPPPPPQVERVAPQAAASVVETAIVEKGRVTLNVEFDTNKTIVKPKYNAVIGELAAVMKKYPDLKIVVEGHTDNVGGAKYNEKLSQRRADAIKKVLTDKFGIEASRLNAKGYGLTKPIASNATKEGRQKNRRVEAAAEYTIKK
ncbi:MAG: OmpA family protein [Deltaproteobacteria bacterium]|nr:OmpA family protein [Deltaproteobacteria bacterium]